MYDYVIIHGSFGNQYENWFPWLFKKLSESNNSVLMPQFPTPKNQSYDRWERILMSYIDLINEKTVFIAHSLGPSFVLDFVIKNKKKIGGFIAVAPFYSLINIQEFDDVNESFFINNLDIEKFTEYCPNRQCIFSDNDPYVPQKLSESFAKNIVAEKNIIPGGKHLNAESGFEEFPQLLKIINKNDK